MKRNCNLKNLNEMKRIALVFAAAIAAFSFAACNKEVAPEEMQPMKQTIIFDIAVDDIDPDTRAKKTGWVDGDKINIWFDGNGGRTADLVLTRNGSNWDAGDLREGVELMPTGGRMVAVYESLNNLAAYDWTESEATYACEQTGSIDGTSFRYTTGLVVGCSGIPYNFSTSVLTGKLSGWKFLNGIQFTITDIPDGEYAFHIEGADEALAPMTSFNVVGGKISADKQSSPSYVGVVAENGNAVVYYTAYERIDDQPVTFWLIPKVNEAYHRYNKIIYSITAPFFLPDGYYAFRIPYRKFTNDYHEYINGHEYVDLGLPSGTKWATCNVGADRPQDYGEYYAWGETELYYHYYDQVFYWNEGKEKYGYAEESYSVTEFADVASTEFGGTWRTPTKAEWEDLMNPQYCTWELHTIDDWSTGFKVTSKANGRSIFLPAAGDVTGLFHNNAGLQGDYWSSSLDDDYPRSNAWSLYFSSSATSSGALVMSSARWLGYSVRPVSN